MDKISIGMNVEIMRSDGRVHGAIITELKHSAKSISVEWFEKGETKGKEVDLNSLIQNNPLIFQSDSTTEKTVKSPSRSHRSISGLGGSLVNTGKNNTKSNEQTNTKLISTKKGNINQEDKRDKKKTSIQTKSSQQKDHKRLSNIAEKPERNPDKESTFSNGNGKEQSRSVTDQEESTKSSMPLAHIEEVDKICNGMSVNIERSDGRIHDAMVINVNRATRMVSVEWFENGETKGKDIDLKAIMRNNSALFRPHIFSLSTSSSKNSLNGPSGYQTDRIDRHSIVTAPAHQSQTTPFSFEQITQKQTTANPIKMDVTYPVENDNNNHDAEESIQRKSRNVNDRRRTYNLEKAVTTRKKNVTTLPQIPDINEDLILLEDNYPIPNEIKENEPIEMIIAAQPQVTSRKSQLLSNIEELERNREQRRAQQGQARRKRELQMQIDPGNPNWEFLSMIRDYQSQLIYRPLRITDAVVDNRICVCVRKRPLSKKEIFNKEVEVVTIPSKDHVVIHQPQVKVDLTKYLVNQKFRFDYAFNENADNELVYKFSAQPLVRTIFQRGFATCFAYGQTGSGKTHTMGGIIEGKRQDCTNGVYAMTAHDVFALLHSPEYRNEGLMASCSFFEIYGTKVFDLLARKAVLRVLEDGKHLVQVVGLKEIQVQSVEDVLKQIKIGSDQRTAGQTSANSNSSRSHAVFQIILRKKDKPSNLYGKFSLIDLAGNERGADTISSDRQTRLEGAEINKSLLALKECIRAMGRDEQHIPFRGSKLTLILRDSFVGRNAKTCMIAMISPGISCVENTMNTLRYADRVKELGSDRDGEDFQPGEEEEYDDLEDLLGAGDFMGAD